MKGKNTGRLPVAPFAALLALLLSAGARSRAEDVLKSTAPAAAPTYVYQGDKFRDPFVPLAGQNMQDIPRYGPGGESEFEPSGIEVKGILKGPAGRVAVLRSSTGLAYMVKEGKIYDSRRKLIKGYVAIIKEKSLVLIGPNNQLTELKIKKAWDDAAKP